MAVGVVTKKKSFRECGDCGSDMAAGVDTCTCGSSNVKKGLYIIRKAEGDDNDDIEAELDELDEELDDLENEDEDEEDDTDSEDDEEEDDDELEDEADEDESEDEDEESEDDEAVAPLTTVGKRRMALEAVNLSTALAEEIVKVFSGKKTDGRRQSYEDVMTQFNTVFDSAAEAWFGGKTVSKSTQGKAQTTLVRKRVEEILKEGGAMPKSKKRERPGTIKFDELPDDVKQYISSLEGGDDEDVEKADIYKGLSPQAAEIVKRSGEIIERDTAKKYMDIAKSLTHVPGERDKLAKALRTAAETSSEDYDTLLASLRASNEVMKSSGIFTTHGSSGDGQSSEVKKHNDRIAKAKELVKAGQFTDEESAYVSLMDGSDYHATNA